MEYAEVRLLNRLDDGVVGFLHAWITGVAFRWLLLIFSMDEAVGCSVVVEQSVDQSVHGTLRERHFVGDHPLHDVELFLHRDCTIVFDPSVICGWRDRGALVI